MDVKILVADDEPTICELIKLYLERDGFTVYTATDSVQALAMKEEYRPDLFIFDIMLAKLSGWEICQRIQRSSPIIFLTANYNQSDMLTVFSLGADDYITKPFSPRELVARVKAILRRRDYYPLSASLVSLPQ